MPIRRRSSPRAGTARVGLQPRLLAAVETYEEMVVALLEGWIAAPH